MGLLLAVIWYNDNPLYGGQPETVLPALFVGMLVAIAQLTAPRVSQMSSPTARTAFSPGGFGGSGSAYASRGVPAIGAPLLRPGAGRRIGSIAAIVIVSGVVGLVAGWGTADNEPKLSTNGGEPSLTHYDKLVRHELDSLSSIRSDDLQGLIAADTPTAQQNAGILIAQAYESTAQALAQAHPQAAQQAAQASLVAKLRRVGVAYRQLAAAAADVDTVAYDAARRAIERAEANLPPPIGSDLTDGSR